MKSTTPGEEKKSMFLSCRTTKQVQKLCYFPFPSLQLITKLVEICWISVLCVSFFRFNDPALRYAYLTLVVLNNVLLGKRYIKVHQRYQKCMSTSTRSSLCLFLPFNFSARQM